MADPSVLEISGLQLSNNTFSASPAGALLEAEGAVMPQKGVIEPVRGQARAYVMPSTSKIPFALTEFLGSVIANYGIDKVDDEFGLGIAANPTVGFTSFGGFFNPVDNDGVSTAYGRMKFGFADQFMHFCSTTGPKTLETLASQPRAAGLLRMGDARPYMQSITVLTPGFLAYNTAVAYRSVLRLPTSTGVPLLSPPSGRAIAQNRLVAPPGAMVRTAGTTVTVTFPNGGFEVGLSVGDTFTLGPGEADFPAGLKTVTFSVANVIKYAEAGANVPNTLPQDFDTGPRSVVLQVQLSPDATVTTPIRIYRSVATSVGNADPSDELFLVAEVFPTAGDITAGLMLYSDTTPDSVLSLTADPLYTNPLTAPNGGSDQGNFQPPLYRDIAVWGGRTWYLNTTNRQQFTLQLLGVGSPDGVQNNDTITIDIANPVGASPYTFTFKSFAGGPPDVQIVSDGLPEFNIEATAQAFILSFNITMALAGEGVRAYYQGEGAKELGKILFERIDSTPAAYNDGFNFIASRPLSWVPALDTSNGTLAPSTAERRPNGLDYSKLGEAEAVPPTNRTAAGSANYAGARIIALTNALIIFKQGDGIYSLTGQAPFQMMQIATANILAPDACVLFGEAAWALTDEGILRISDSGGSVVVSRPIETELLRLQSLLLEQTRDYAFAVAYETERRILFFLPMDMNEAFTPGAEELPRMRAYCYNNATQAWTGPLYDNAFSGIVGRDVGRLFLGTYDVPWATSRITGERRNTDFDLNQPAYVDYADASFSNSISTLAADPLVVRLGSANDVEAGDVVVQGQWYTKIRELRPDLGTRWVELYEEIPWTVAACSVYKGYLFRVVFQPSDSPTLLKHIARLVWLAKPEWFCTFTGKTLLLTDQCQSFLEIPTPFVGFGLTPFGVGGFGDPSPLVVDVNPIAASHAQGAQFFVGFQSREAFMQLRLQGFGRQVETDTGPAGRGR